MELDKRIVPGKRPLSCFDTEQAKEFLGKECYFSDHLCTFNELLDAYSYVTADMLVSKEKHLYVGELLSVSDSDGSCYEAGINGEAEWFQFCLPCEWVEEKKEPEKKYRVLTLNEFLERFKIGDAIYIRFKKDGAERVVVFSEYNIPPHKDEGNNTESVCLNGIEHHLKSIVCLGMREYNLTTLFDCYEYFDGKEWQPFGVKEIPEV